MKRISLTAWIFIGMAAGIALGYWRSRHSRVQLAPSQQYLSSADQVDHRAAAVRDAGGGHRQHRQRQGDGPHRREGDRLLRGRDDDRPVPRAGRGQSRRGPAKACSWSDRPRRLRCRRPQQTAGAILEHTFPTSIIDAMARGEVLQIVVFSFLFGAACAASEPRRSRSWTSRNRSPR